MSSTDYIRIRSNFEKKAITDYGTTVTRTPVTKTTSNVYSDETLTDGSTENITVYIVKRVTKWDFDKSGEIEGGDALMLSLHTTTINRNDKITFLSNDYRVRDKHPVSINGNVIYYRYNLFLI